MNFQNLKTVADEAVSAFSGRVPLTALPDDAHTAMRYPKFPAIMRFSVQRYAAAGFGNVFSMYTRAMGGLMQLCTLVFTPNLGVDVPLLLIDVMAFMKKRAVFVEYYDCTENGAHRPALEGVHTAFSALPEYPETPAWYVAERTPYSLIKGGADEEALLSMLAASVSAYAEVCAAATGEAGEENLAKLSLFIERMVKEGNPSSATMERVLGREGAETFFRTAVMPAVFIPAGEPVRADA